MIRVPGVDTDNCAWMFGSDSSSWPQHRPNTKRSTMNITWHHFYIIFIYICIFFERCADCATQSKDPWSFTRCFFKQYHSLLVVKKNETWICMDSLVKLLYLIGIDCRLFARCTKLQFKWEICRDGQRSLDLTFAESSSLFLAAFRYDSVHKALGTKWEFLETMIVFFMSSLKSKQFFILYIHVDI